MGLKHISNDTPNVMFVGGKMIPPGEGRDIDERDLPPEHREPAPEPEPEAPSLDDELGVLLNEGTVKELTGLLPSLTIESLDRLAELERAREHPRKTLLEALADEALRRANEALAGDTLDGDDDVNAGV